MRAGGTTRNTECPSASVPARLCLGAGRSAAEGGDRAYLADLTDRFPEARGTISGTQQAVQALGLVIGPLIGGYAAELYGAPSVFYLISGAALVCTAGYSLLPDINASAEQEAEKLALSMDMSQQEEEEFAREQEAAKAASDWGALLKSNRQRVITFAAGANAFGFVAKLTCIPWFATASLGASPQQVGELFSLTALLGMASAPLGGVIADKIGLKAVIVASLAAGSSIHTPHPTPHRSWAHTPQIMGPHPTDHGPTPHRSWALTRPSVVVSQSLSPTTSI